jgi:fatty acid amide hydrolase 2
VTSLTERSARRLAQAIAAREVSSRDVVEAHIERLVATDRTLNAIAVKRFDAARREAERVDARLAGGPDASRLPPLLGVPCTIKEVFAVAGMPNSAGLLARRNVRANDTAVAARRLTGSGAIVLGLTNTFELAAWIETDNPVYGRTSNPYDPGRTAGGSSGGEGAAVGVGGSPFGIGTDIGGSIRIPAFCCGVFAHKPSVGLVPHTGVFPEVTGEAKRILAYGPIARRAEDLMPVLRILAGPDGVDPLAQPMTLAEPGDVELAGLPVLVSEDAFPRPIAPELLAARERAAAALADMGARIERVSLPEFRPRMQAILAALSDGGRLTLASIFASGGLTPIPLREVLRSRDRHTLPVRMWVVAERLQSRLPERRMRRLITEGREFAERVRALIGEGVLLHPPLPTVAPAHRRTYGRILFSHPTAVFNLAGVPVTQVPLGLGEERLPLGVQVAAGPGRDHVAIAVAQALERAFGGWVPPPALTGPSRRDSPRAARAPT